MIRSLREKYAARAEELLSLEVELDGGKRPGGPAPLVGRLLEAAGDLLRRATSLGADRATVDRALQRLSDAALSSWSCAVEVGEVSGRLARAASQAVEVAIPDVPEEADTIAGWAMQDLQARDRLESTLVALERLAGLGRDDARALVTQLRGAVTTIDANCRASVASLTPLNPYRRPEAMLLDEPERLRAWWFSGRSGIDDDLLVPILGGERPGTLAPAELEVGEVVASRRSRPISSDDLLRLDLGLASDAERESIARRATRDPELRLALAAMEEGDRAIDEVLQGAAPERPVVTLPTASRATPPDVIEDNADFKVLVFRGPRTVQVVVQPSDPRRLAAAAVFLPDDIGRPLEPFAGEQGLQFELGSPEPLLGQSARLVVKMLDGKSHSVEVRL